MRGSLISLLLFTAFGHAAWTRLQGPPADSGASDPVLSIVSHGQDLWAVTHAGLFQSKDSGRTWSDRRPDSFPRDAAFAANNSGKLFSAAGCLFATAQTGLFRSCGTGDTWSRFDGTPEAGWFRRLQGDSGLLVAGGSESDRPWYSLDLGRTWRIAPGFQAGEAPVTAIYQDGSRLWVSGFELAYSQDKGKTWEARVPGSFHFLARRQGRLWAGSPWGSLMSSEDSGQSWSDAEVPEPVESVPLYLHPSGLAEVDSLLFISGYIENFVLGGVYMSRDTGKTWIPRNNGFRTETVVDTQVADAHEVHAMGKILIAKTLRGVYRSTDLGATWIPANSGLPSFALAMHALDAIVPHEGSLYAMANRPTGFAWFVSRDTARTWTAWNPGVADAQRLVFTSKAAFVVRAAADSALPDPVYYSTDGMATWQRLRGSWEGDSHLLVESLFASQDYAVLTMGTGSVDRHWVSSDGGLTWGADSVHLLAEKFRLRIAAGGAEYRTNLWTLEKDVGEADWRAVFTESGDIEAVAAHNGNLVVLVNDNLYASTDAGLNWYPGRFGSSRPARMHSLALHGGRLFAGTSRGLWTSANGLDWEPAGERGLSTAGLRAVAASGDNLVAVTNQRMFYSTDHGTSWKEASGLPIPAKESPPMHWVHAQGGMFYAGHATSGLWASADSGKTWSRRTGFGKPVDRFLDGMGTGPLGVYAVNHEHRVMLSRDSGNTWTEWGPAPSLHGEPTPVTGADGGLYSLPAGDGYFAANGSWAKENLPGSGPHDFLAGDAGAVAISSGEGLYFRPSRTAVWMPVTGELPEKAWTALAMDGNRLYAGLATQGLWMNASLPLNTRPIAPAEDGKLTILPGAAGRRVFRFQLARPGQVRLSLHTATGRTVASVSAALPGGRQELQVKARAEAPVFYRLEIRAGNGSAPIRILQGRLPPR